MTELAGFGTDTPAVTGAATAWVGRESSRTVVIFALSYPQDALDESAAVAIGALLDFADVTVVVPATAPAQLSTEIRALGARVRRAGGDHFASTWYRDAVSELAPQAAYDEYVLTGDSWLGPAGDLRAVAERMRDTRADFWQMVAGPGSAARFFPEEGFPNIPRAWVWTAVRRSVVDEGAWVSLWRTPASDELSFIAALEADGYRGAEAFPRRDLPTDDPALLAAEDLIAAGCPLLLRRIFELYPPFLHRHAIIGRDILATAAVRGMNLNPVWKSLARTVPSKALNTNAGMLEVIVSGRAGALNENPAAVDTVRIAALAHITRLDAAEALFESIAHLPPGCDVIVTTTDGIKALRLQSIAQPFIDEGRFGAIDVRVTPSGRGRDMSDFFVANRDVLTGDRYDLIVKVHARRQRHKTVNARRYFQRYQVENLLESTEHVRGILTLFQREPGLGAVFPPMMHIGYATMGGGWANCRAATQRLCARLGISVPLDRVSPLAPYGAMWIARPEAFAVMTSHRWAHRDYRVRKHPWRKTARSPELAKVQERIIVPALAEAGYHCRTVLSAQHAAISHTAAEFKLDELFETTHGHPLDAIVLMHRAGYTGYGGALAVLQMYLNLHHRRIAAATAPLFTGARHAILLTRAIRQTLRGRGTGQGEVL